MDKQQKEMIGMMTSGLRHLDVDIEMVEVLHKSHSRSEKKQCYNNSYRFVSDHYSQHPKYVLGYVFLHGSIPIEHAWVSVNEHYFDVTLDPGNDDVYVKVVEVPEALLLDYINQQGHAPDLNSLNRFVGARKK